MIIESIDWYVITNSSFNFNESVTLLYNFVFSNWQLLSALTLKNKSIGVVLIILSFLKFEKFINFTNNLLVVNTSFSGILSTTFNSSDTLPEGVFVIQSVKLHLAL